MEATILQLATKAVLQDIERHDSASAAVRRRAETLGV